MSGQDVQPYMDEFNSVVNGILRSKSSSNARDPSLSDLAKTIDDRQARSIMAQLRERLKQPTHEDHDPYTEMRIGTTWLLVPPSAIRIRDMRLNDDVSGLRSTTNSLIKTGRGRIKIDLVLDFPNEDSINKQLRPIIAQFRTTPFLPVESQYLFNGINAIAAGLDPKYLDDLRLKLDRVWKDYNDAKDHMVTAIIDNGTLMAIAALKEPLLSLAEIVEKYRFMFPDELVDLVSDLVQSLSNKGLAGVEYVDKGEILNVGQGSEYQKNLRSLMQVRQMAQTANKALNDIRSIYSDLAKVGLSEASRRPIVHVILHTLAVQTIPDEVSALRVQLSMIYFAYGAYVSEMAYKNPEGYPTLDVGECPYFDAYVRRRFLQASTNVLADEEKVPRGLRYLGQFSTQSGQSWLFRYPTPLFQPVADGEPSDEDLVPQMRADHIGGGRAYNLAAKDTDAKPKMWRAGEENLKILPDDDTIVPKQVIVTIQNRIALQPIQCSMYGTAQHLGAINARISVSFDVVGNGKEAHNLGVAKLQRMKLQSDSVALIGGPRIRRNSRIRVQNGILALLGVHYVQLDNVSVHTNPGEIWSSSVQLDMTECTISQEKKEQLRLQKANYRGSLISGSLAFGVDVVNKYLRGDSSGKRGYLAVNSDAGQYCRAVLYGGKSPIDEGILSQRLITYVLLNNAYVRRTLAKAMHEAANSTTSGGSKPDDTPNYDWVRIDPYSVSRLDTSNNYVRSVPRERQLEDILTSECGRLAKEMLEFWKRSKLSVSKGSGSVPTVMRDSKNLIDIEDTPLRYLTDIERAFNNPDFGELKSWMDAFGDYCLDNFEEIQLYYQSRVEGIRSNSNYPDLDLPTYSDIFLGSKEAVSEGLGAPVDDMEVKLLRIFTYKYLGSKTKEILRRFIPTYRDLGKRAPLTQDPYDLAKKFEDFVDPDFFYYYHRVSQQFDSFAAEVEDETDRLFSPSSNFLETDPVKRLGDQEQRAEAKRVQRARGKSDDLAKKFIDSPDDVTLNLDLVPNPEGKPVAWFYKNGQWCPTRPKAGLGTDDYHRYTSGDPKIQQTMTRLIHDDPGHLGSLFRETVASQKDNLDRMIRAYPTFRFSFVEEDNEEWGLWDDFYSYNSIIDIMISEHKFEPSLLQIRIINTTGNLDEARSLIGDPDRVEEDASWVSSDGTFKDPRAPIGDPNVEDETGEPRELSKFFLQTGTNVMLKLGYGSGEDDLETVFVGQVVEVDPGDVITLICQSYKNELTVPLNTYKDGYDSDPYDVLKYVMEESPTEHFGRWSPYESGLVPGRNRAGELYDASSSERLGWQGYRQGPFGQNEAYDKLNSQYGEVLESGYSALKSTASFFGSPNSNVMPSYGSLDHTYKALSDPRSMNQASYALQGVNALTQVPGFIATVTSDRKLANVYMPRHSWLHEVFSFSREFLIPDRSGLEVLHELTRHMPGYVCDVRPYDHKATLFFGKPEQRYFYTSGKLHEERLWKQVQDRQTKESQEAWDAFVRLMVSFENGYEAAMFKATMKLRHSSGRGLKQSLAGVAGSLPGKAIGFVSFGYLGGDIERAGERIGRNIFTSGYESPDRLTELKHLDQYLGQVNLKAAVAYFFDRWAGDYGSGQAGADIIAGAALIAATAGLARGTFGKGVRELVTGEAKVGSGVGTMFISLTNWRDKVDRITSKNDGTAKTSEDLRLQVFEMNTDVTLLNMARDKNAGVTDAAGRQLNRDTYEKAVYAILDYIPDWKDFLVMFDLFIQRKLAEQDTDILKMAYKTSKMIERFEHNPRTKKFRGHHYVDSTRHIIKNSIAATKEQMANVVVIKYMSDVDYIEAGGKYYEASDASWDTFELAADQNIQVSEKKVRLVTEINADSTDKAKLVAFSNLAEALRPMYRGELILRGDETIRPFDTVWISDIYENMFGPVEVERVITHFSSETGYTTTVIPQLVAIPCSRSSWIDNLACGQIMALKAWNAIPSAGANIRKELGLGTGFASTLLLGGAPSLLAGGLYQDFQLKEMTGAGILGNLTGRGKYGNLRTPVDIVPLIRNGIPWTAGLRGWGDNNWKLRIFKRWSNVKCGLGVALGGITSALNKKG
jgi:hypothetical protein